MWLKVSKDGDAGINLLWGNDSGPYDPYHIGPGTLTAACGAARAALTELVRLYGADEPRRRARALRRLAAAGAELHYVLFNALSNPNEAQSAKSAKNGLAAHYASSLEHKKRIANLRITGHPQIHVPWALVFEGNPDDLPSDRVDLAAYEGFWGLKYGLSSCSSGYNKPVVQLVRRVDRAKLLSLMHFAAAEQAEGNFSDELKAAYAALRNLPVGVAHDLETYTELIEKAVSYDTILYIFTHQENGKLDLGDEDPIGIIKFRMLLDRLAEQSSDAPSYSLVILNACESANGEMDYSFVSAIDRPGVCGSIGTESLIPRDFAALFAIRFLTLMLAHGKSVGDAMALLRREPSLWPLSLAYGCYAHPDYRIEVNAASI